MDKKVVIGFLIALLAIILVGFVAMHFVPTEDLIDLNVSSNLTDLQENLTENITENLTNVEVNATAVNATASNDTATNVTDDVVNDTNASSDDIDSGDVLHKQTFTITGNETGQNEDMEPGTYVMYYTENDGIIKVEKIA